MTCDKHTCRRGKIKDLAGKHFGRLTVIGLSHTDGQYSYWICQCTCGQKKIIRRNSLTQGNATSCGCKSKENLEAGRYKHGCAGSRTKEYRCWEGIVQRATNTTRKGAKDYVLRGIDVCERWRNSFESFLADMGNAPSDNHSIDRIDNNQGYNPANCRWASKKQQARNMRKNRIITIDGSTYCLAEWIEMFGLKYNTVLYRIRRGWSDKDAILGKQR